MTLRFSKLDDGVMRFTKAGEQVPVSVAPVDAGSQAGAQELAAE